MQYKNRSTYGGFKESSGKDVPHFLKVVRSFFFIFVGLTFYRGFGIQYDVIRSRALAGIFSKKCPFVCV